MSQSSQQNDVRGSEHRGPVKGSALGVASVIQVMAGARFPMSKQDLSRQYGAAQIHWNKDTTETLGDILERVVQDDFLSRADLAAAVADAHRAWPRA